ncbi:hypothetical protein GBA52_026773 [Prunus armeniaca]|nr:hypothetical protein GBA52_026773 [Prunus armeniaca]
MLVALLVGHTMAQSPAKLPALSPTRSPPASAPSPSSAAPSTPKENDVVLNRLSASASVVIGLCAVVLVM